MIDQLGAKLRNMFVAGKFQKRYSDGRIQVRTHNARVIEKKEAFPYGFYAKAKSGRAFIFCQGGNLDGFEIFPVQPGDDITPPKLEEGDTALYTASGAWMICRDDGSAEIHGKAGALTIDETGNITGTGTAIAWQKNGLPAARKTDPVQSTAADDTAFWQWVTTVSSILASITGGSLTPPTMINSKITGGSATVTIG
jgi:hypothetical protein